MAQQKTIKIEQVGSPLRRHFDQRATLIGLGLNKIGRVNEVHVFLEEDEPNGFYIEEALSGSRIADVIEGVQYQQEDLCRKMKAQIDAATRKDMVKPREGVRLLEFYESQMLNKTYLNIEPKNGRKKRER